MLVLWDLSAAFNTVDQNILLDRLKCWVGLWNSYLIVQVLLKWSWLTTAELAWYPAKLYLRSIFFRLYLLSLTNGIRNCNINCHNYADQGDCFDGSLEAHAILYIQTWLSMMMILVLCEWQKNKGLWNLGYFCTYSLWRQLGQIWICPQLWLTNEIILLLFL